MAIYLVQHGKAVSEDKDSTRPLSTDGVKESAHIASIAEYYMLLVNRIEHSSKLRARQTAEIFAKKLRLEDKVKENSALNPSANVEEFAQKLQANENVLLVGHMPFLQKLLALLLTGDQNHKIFAIQNSGMICIDKDEDSSEWHIKWTFSRDIK